jgi:hypothetical protein
MLNQTYKSFKDKLLETDFTNSQCDESVINRINQIYTFAKTSKLDIYKDVMEELKFLNAKSKESDVKKGLPDVTINREGRGFDTIKLTLMNENCIKGHMPTTLASDPHDFPSEQVYFDTDFILKDEILFLDYTYFNVNSEVEDEKEKHENLLKISYKYDGKKIIGFDQQKLANSINKGL